MRGIASDLCRLIRVGTRRRGARSVDAFHLVGALRADSYTEASW